MQVFIHLDAAPAGQQPTLVMFIGILVT